MRNAPEGSELSEEERIALHRDESQLVHHAIGHRQRHGDHGAGDHRLLTQRSPWTTRTPIVLTKRSANLESPPPPEDAWADEIGVRGFEAKSMREFAAVRGSEGGHEEVGV